MTALNLRLQNPERATTGRHFQQPIGQILVDCGVMDSSQLLQALAIHGQCRAPVSRICVTEGFATEEQVLTAQSQQWGALRLTLADDPPDPDLADVLPAEFCRDNAVLPWGRLGNMLLVATSRPEEFATVMATLPDAPDNVMMALASERDIHRILSRRHRDQFRQEAEAAVPEDDSCRSFTVGGSTALSKSLTGLAIFAVLAGLWSVPNMFFIGLVIWASITLFVALGLKISAYFAATRAARPQFISTRTPRDLPIVSIMVPLFREKEIARALLARLSRLRYPRALLDIVLVLEENDDQTRAVLDKVLLPPWMRIVQVPDGALKTKPRALNYALGFCRGSIVGVYDAEDAPDPDQIEKVVAQFQNGPADLACVQGVLDYYNPRANWLARCFTIEYATWFRVILPGMVRLGLAIPLGGTTVFFRRDILQKLNGWDAHNVTEDADLGMRLARHGYRTEMIDSVTSEEANNRFWPWIRQRSRWLKGYMLTYLIHMRRPAELYKQLGPWRFFGFQVFFVTAISQFLLAPVLWSFWLVPLGFPHPFSGLLGQNALILLAGGFLTATAIDLSVSLAACGRTPHTGVKRWVPTMLLYFPIATLAAYKGLWEILTRPFYWDKTSHGHSQPTASGSPGKFS